VSFDLLWRDGQDMRQRPLLEAQGGASPSFTAARWRDCSVPEHLACSGRALFERTRELGVEGLETR
jgi:hypothetical protein